VLVCVALLLSRIDAQTSPALDDVLERFRGYLVEYANNLPATIATEHYLQRVGSGVRYQLRKLESEYGIITVPGAPEWLGFREVLSVDGKAVSDSASRLGQLFARPSPQALVQARRLALESARYNIGPVVRTINDPAFAMELLDPRNSERMKFSKTGEAKVGATAVWIIRFEEIARPTITKTRDGLDQPAEGRVWVDPLTGHLLRAEIIMKAGLAAGNFISTIGVLFEQNPNLGFPVPFKLTEQYQNGRNLVVVASGEATYTNYRRFTVDTRENVIP
jgi:hypothetical protein